MLSKLEVRPTIPAADLNRARRFYAEKLGLTPVEDSPAGLTYGDGCCGFLLYPTAEAGRATHTLMAFDTDDLDREMSTLKAKGVVFENYDMPGLRTVNGVADMNGEGRAAWFKDSEGNIIALAERGDGGV